MVSHRMCQFNLVKDLLPFPNEDGAVDAAAGEKAGDRPSEAGNASRMEAREASHKRGASLPKKKGCFGSTHPAKKDFFNY